MDALSFDQAAALGPGGGSSGGITPPLSFEQAAALPPPTAPLQPDQITGLVPNVAAGAAEGGSWLVNTATDPFGNLIGLPFERLAMWGHDVIGPMFGTKPFTPEERAALLAPVGEQPGTALVNRGATAVGLPTPEQVVPGGPGEAIARAGAAGLVAGAALGGGGVGSALRTGATMGGLQAAGQGASMVVPPEWQDVANMGVQLSLGVGAPPVASAAGRMIGRPVARVAAPLGVSAPEPIVNPETGQPFTSIAQPGAEGAPVSATPAVQRAAAQQVSSAMGKTPEAAAQVFATIPESEIPGVQLSAGQTTGNLDLLNLERTVGSTPTGRAAQTAARASNDVALVQALKGAAPEDVGEAAGDWFRTKLDHLEAANAAESARAGSAAATAAEATGATGLLPDIQTAGGAIRDPLEAIRAPLKDQLGRAYTALDPDGTLAVDTTPVADVARSIRDEMGKRPDLFPGEADRLADADDLRGVNLFSDVRALQSNMSAILKRIRNNPEYGAESQPYRRMSQLMAATHDAIGAAAARAAEREATSEVPSGSRIVDRLAGIDQGVQQSGGRGPVVAAGAGEAPAGAAPGGGIGTPEATAAPAVVGPGPGGLAGNRGVAPPAPNLAAETLGRIRAPEDAVSFLISKGGVKPSQHLTEDVASVHHRQAGRLLNPNGLTLHEAREWLEQEHFLPGNSLDAEAAQYINDAAAEHISGRRVYRPDDQAEAEYYENTRAEAARREHQEGLYRDQVLQAEDAAGLRLSDSEIEHATRMMVDDPHLHPDEALRQAVHASEEIGLQRNAERNAFGYPGVPLAEQPELGIGRPAPLEENMTPETARDLRDLNRRYAQYKDTFRSGAVGEILRSGGGSGGFKAGESAVPGLAFRKGPKGADAADSLIKAHGGDVKAAQGALGEYPAMVFRNEVMPSGTVNLASFDKFQRQWAPALGKFPDLARKFQTAAEGQRQVEAAAARGDARVKQFQDSAASAYLNKRTGEPVDATTAVRNLLKAPNAGDAFRSVMEDARGNDAAVDGLRRNLMDEIQRRAQTTTPIGDTGERSLGAASFKRATSDPKMAAAIKASFTPEQQQLVRTIGDTLDAAARAWNGVKIPGSPGSAADAAALGKVLEKEHGSPSQLFQLLMFDKLGEMLGHALNAGTGLWGTAIQMAGVFGGRMLMARRAAALDKTADLVNQMLLQPKLGRVLLERAITTADSPRISRLGNRIVSLGAGASLASQGSH